MEYYFSKTVNMPFEQAIERVTGELAREGFGVLTRIDMRETLKKKLVLWKDEWVGAILGANKRPVLMLSSYPYERSVRSSSRTSGTVVHRVDHLRR